MLFALLTEATSAKPTDAPAGETAGKSGDSDKFFQKLVEGLKSVKPSDEGPNAESEARVEKESAQA